MTYKLFLDDLRDPINNDWVIARSSKEAIEVVEKHGMPIEITFDHDLGGDDTSIIFINFLTNYLLDNPFYLSDDFCYSIHSANPVGRQNIDGKMKPLIKEIMNIKNKG